MQAAALTQARLIGDDTIHAQKVEKVSEILESFKQNADEKAKNLFAEKEKKQALIVEAMSKAESQKTRQLLQALLDKNQREMQEFLKLYSDIGVYAQTFEQVIGSTLAGGNGKSCADVICGMHATCTMTTEGAQCICDQGYMGDGMQCALPRAMAVPNFVLNDGPLGKSKQV